MKKYSNCKEINRYVKRQVQKGWFFTHGKKHGKLSHPSGKVVLIVPKTPSDWRAPLNFHRDLDRAINMIV